MTTTSPNIRTTDVQNHLHPFTPYSTYTDQNPTIITSGSGITIRDADGHELIDAMAGLWCVNVGWGRDEIIDAIAEQGKTLPYYHSFAGHSNEPVARLSSRLTEKTGMSKIFFGSSGSDANDTNVKLVWHYNNLRGKPAKKKVIARQRAYHGVTVVAASLSGLSHMHKAFDVPLPQIKHVSTPHHYWFGGELSEEAYSQELARELDTFIEAEGPDTVAAFIAEPLMGAGGVIVPPKGYFEAIQPVLDKHDVLLIADEVICGFGRLGTWFGSDYYNLKPDVMTIAKGLTSGYLPMSGSLISEKIWQTFLEHASETGGFMHGYTYSSHPLAAAAANANLDIIERENLVGNAKEVGAYFQNKLRSCFAEHPLVGEVRGVGLVAAIEFVKDKQQKIPFDLSDSVAPAMAAYCRNKGLICRPLPISNAMSFSPPLTITTSDVDEIITRFDQALHVLVDDLKRKGVWQG